MKILVTGAAGQLGYDVCKELAKRGIEHKGIDRSELDICDRAAVEEYLLAYAPEAVIHCAAYTAVDKAEDEPELCFAVNAGGTRNLAEVCKQLDCKLLYISTDYVFDGQGDQFYEVSYNFNPLGVYGASKLAGEMAVKSILEKYFIVRISWAFGKNGANFVKTMLRLAETHSEVGVVCDQVGSPTYTADLAKLLVDMVQTEKYAIYHATNEGVCSWAEFAEEIFKQAGSDVKVRHLTTAEYPTKARRPFNSRLSKECLDKAGFKRLPDWRDALQIYLTEIDEV
jgi:dTDP-4-dehydrorhamnose reductase